MKKLVIALSLTLLLLSAAVGVFMSTAARAVHPALQRMKHTCAAMPAGYASCKAILMISGSVTPNLGSGPSGYHPSNLQSAYKLPSSTAGSGQTVAIVDAYNDPKAEADLAVYRSQFGLPACTIANGCFKQVNQNGNASPLPKNSGSWSQEISLDLDMVSAICPKCNILLVEASSASLANLGTSVNTAANLGANAISNSYGGAEGNGELSYASDYNHKGIAITASAGDTGYGTQIPAAYNTVTAVGGTTLKSSGNARGWSETAWSGTGSGCSAFISKPGWQTDKGCNNRTIADVSAVADPSTGVSVYDSYGYQGSKGWLVFGGTSVSAPIIASVYALAGNANNINYGSFLYSHTGGLNDIVVGSNGTCNSSYLCTAGPGYDGPTGLGTPNGTAAF